MSDTDRNIDRLHNNPPSEEQILIDEIKSRHDDILALYENNLAKAAAIPTEVNDDATAGIVSDFVKKLSSTKKTLNGLREDEKEGFLKKGRAVDAFFKSRMEKLDALKAQIEEPLARYLKKKEDEKRRIAEEKAERERQEAAEKLRIAQENERIAKEKAEAEQKAKEEAERKLQEERDKAAKEQERIRREAEEEAARVKAEADRKQREADEEIARLKKAEEDRKAAAALEALIDDAQAEAEAENIRRDLEAAERRKKEADKEVKVADKTAANIIKDADKATKEIDKNVRQTEAALDNTVREASREAKDAKREFHSSLDDANRQDKYAVKAERATMEKGSVLSRTRGEESVSSVTEVWVGSIISREALTPSMARIWPHIPFDALEQAVNAMVRAGEREIEGVVISKDTKAVVRG